MHNCKIKAVMSVMGECRAVHLNFYFPEMFTKNALTITRGGNQTIYRIKCRLFAFQTTLTQTQRSQ